MRFLAYFWIFLAIFSFVNCDLKSSDVEEGDCVDIPADTKSNPFFIFSSIDKWYIPIGSEFGFRFDAEVMLGGRSLANQSEFEKLQSKSSVLYLPTSLDLPALGAVYGFNDKIVIKSNCIPVGYLKVRCDCLPILNDDSIHCENLNPHYVTIIEANKDEGYYIVNVCPRHQKRYWFAMSKKPKLSIDAMDKIKKTILKTGYYSEERFAYQYYPN